MRIVLTGGAGFIGSAVIREIIRNTSHEVLNIDKLTYAGNTDNCKEIEDSPRYSFLQADICDGCAITDAMESFQPDTVMHFAAESHVDRSIDGAAEFVSTNVVGTYRFLENCRAYYNGLDENRKGKFRFQHISTDEVYGSLGDEGSFTESMPYDPRSPYSASKAASDHMVMAWYHTYGLPVLITNCSNNYGPYHFPEKLIPLVILNALDGQSLPVYGTGDNVRDWLHVEDHARALLTVMEKGSVGEKYNIGGNSEKSNIQIVESICELLDEMIPEKRPLNMESYKDLIVFVPDRPGHDKRYAIDASKIKNELGWQPLENFDSGIRKTVKWYLENEWWWLPIRENRYSGQRLGIRQ